MFASKQYKQIYHGNANRMLFLAGMPPNADYKVLEKEIRKLLEQKCTVDVVSIRTKANNSYAFITIKEAQKVDAVIQAYNGAVIEGRNITLQRKLLIKPEKCQNCGMTNHLAKNCKHPPNKAIDKKMDDGKKEETHIKKQKHGKRYESEQSNQSRGRSQRGKKVEKRSRSRDRHNKGKKDRRKQTYTSSSSDYSSESEDQYVKKLLAVVKNNLYYRKHANDLREKQQKEKKKREKQEAQSKKKKQLCS